MLAAAKKKIQSFFAVAHYEDAVGQLPLAQGVQRQVDIILAVFDQQYIYFRIHTPPADAAFFSCRHAALPRVK